MRLLINFLPKSLDGELFIPFDFRRHFISVVKTLFRGKGSFDRFQEEKPGYSPYTFSLGFGKIIRFKPDSREIIAMPPVNMFFSTGIYEIMTDICNGAIEMKGQELSDSLGLTLKNVTLMPDKRIKASIKTFKIHSHAVLRGQDDYLDGSDYRLLEEAINTHMHKQHCFLQQQYGYLQNGVGPVQVDQDLSRIRKGVCYHYGGNLTTLQGTISLRGTPGSLRFLYDFGIGVRCGQGYGLLTGGE